jgi:hypothetical protein
MSLPQISYKGKTLVAEWDNRQARTFWFQTIFLATFLVIWTPATFGMTVQLILGNGPRWFLLIWLVFGYMGVIVIPIALWLRNSVERVEIDNSFYRHINVTHPGWFPTEWKVDNISRIEFTYGESTTLTVHCGWKRKMIGVQADDAFRRFLFEAIRHHLNKIDSPIEVVDKVPLSKK